MLKKYKNERVRIKEMSCKREKKQIKTNRAVTATNYNNDMNNTNKDERKITKARRK